MKKSYSLKYNENKERKILIFGDDLKFDQDETLNL
jgi:hypothetical protein